MTSEIPARIISPLVTGTGAPIISDLHLHHLRGNASVMWSSLVREIIRWSLTRAFSRAEQLNLFRS
jgi:hypothetical protein